MEKIICLIIPGQIIIKTLYVIIQIDASSNYTCLMFSDVLYTNMKKKQQIQLI